MIVIEDKSKIIEKLNNITMKIHLGCWLYKGRKNTDGYGQIEIKTDIGWRQVSVHRLSAYLFFNMSIDSENHILHKVQCPNKNCWNPEHIYQGNQSQNSLDAVTTKTHNMTRNTHCVRGHLMDGIKMTTREGAVRYCKTCASDASKRFRARHRRKNA